MASPTKGNTTSANPTPANNFYQFNHNQNSGSDRLLVFQLTMANTTYPTTATYGGQTMTRLYTTNRGGLSQRMAFYYLVDPPTGVNVLRVNFNANQWNPISVHSRSFTDSGGIGNHSLTGGSATPNTRTLTISQDDSLILMTSCSVNQVLTQQIPTGSNKSFITHNTNRQVATGAISSNSGHSAGSVSLRSTATWGGVTLDRIEIKGVDNSNNSTSPGNEDFFSVLTF
jgi:hypothetical protein|tara:strand:+ start:1009 stop:1692 length:684 start_codon:yes stop_codon:yes gene_type:complete